MSIYPYLHATTTEKETCFSFFLKLMKSNKVNIFLQIMFFNCSFKKIDTKKYVSLKIYYLKVITF